MDEDWENKIKTKKNYLILNGIRGDKCEAIYYHTKANNKYVNPDFNKDNEKESYIISLDAN